MILRVRPEAAEEFAEAVRYYNKERSGLGFEFAAEVRNVFTRIKKYPDTWPMITGNIRRCMVTRFPYAVLYNRDGERLLVVAIMHLKRKPGYWRRED
ncbi:MAG: type II toxin-antitoxin system RelE/ParE family toxin [Spirochaetes bacterium]|nr:MAG: type II toxin-antitoxin system RelE/ParE family toxin [Spirochaetota bacterium]